MSNNINMSIAWIEKRILLIRGQRVKLDDDLAQLYGVETKALKRAVRRNKNRFPDDFMFTLNNEEYGVFLRYQFGTLKRGQHSKYMPYAFTEQGVAMLSSVLHSPRATRMNIAIMRAFVRLREIIGTHKDLMIKLEEMERKYQSHDVQIRGIFEAIRQLMEPEQKPRRRVGFEVGR
jgi:ORF6N domain